MIKSKFNTDAIQNFVFVALISAGGALVFIIQILLALVKGLEVFNLNVILFLAFMISLFVLTLLFLNIFKVIKLHKGEIKYFCLLKPFGNTIYFEDFIGFIESKETTMDGEIKVIHFVDKKGYTSFKINLSHYKNKNEVKESILLKEIKNYNWSLLIYLKLIFTGKIKVL